MAKAKPSTRATKAAEKKIAAKLKTAQKLADKKAAADKVAAELAATIDAEVVKEIASELVKDEVVIIPDDIGDIANILDLAPDDDVSSTIAIIEKATAILTDDLPDDIEETEDNQAEGKPASTIAEDATALLDDIEETEDTDGSSTETDYTIELLHRFNYYWKNRGLNRRIALAKAEEDCKDLK